MKSNLLLFFTTITLSLNSMALTGIELFKDKKYKQAYVKLISQPEPGSSFYLGVMNFLGKGTDVNLDKAIDFWTIGWSNGDENSGITLGLHFLKDTASPEKGIQILTEVSNAKNSMNAQYELAKFFGNKNNNLFDIKKSFTWFEKAATNNKVEAQASLGLMFYYGDGTDKNLEKSKFWYKKSAEAGFENSQYALGVLLFKDDIQQSVFWLTNAAKQNHIEAIMTLADYYHREENNTEKSVFWFSRALELGNDDAILPLGILLYSSKDKAKHEKGLSMISKCTVQGKKDCMIVSLDIFMHNRYLEAIAKKQ